MTCPSVVKSTRKKKNTHRISVEKDEGKRSPEKEVNTGRKC
jgi:hypothetical protein